MDFMPPEAHAVNLADSIRQFVYTQYVRPALDAGKTEIIIRAGDVHDQMRLQSRMPSVCQALETEIFHTSFNLQLVRHVTPPKGKGANVYFHFRIGAKAPLPRELVRAKPAKSERGYAPHLTDFLHNYQRYYDVFCARSVFTGPSLHFHRKAIAMKDHPDRERALEYIYATLVAWGMHRMGPKGAKMKDFESFAASVATVRSLIDDASHFDIFTMTQENWQVLETIFRNIAVMQSGVKLVGNSKVMAHLLPHLVPPIDRAYTLAYLGEAISGDEWEIMKRIIQGFFMPVIADPGFKAFALQKVQGNRPDGWDTSILKMVDNVIIGAVKA